MNIFNVKNLVMAALVATVSSGVNAKEEDPFFIDPHDLEIQILMDRCVIKATFFEDILLVRGSVQEREDEMNHILSIVEKTGSDKDSKMEHYEHVDNLRLVRDAYRLSGGDYRVKDAEDFGVAVYKDCLINKF